MIPEHAKARTRQVPDAIAGSWKYNGGINREESWMKKINCLNSCVAAMWVIGMWFLIAGALLFTLASWKVLKWWNWL
jgi:hypothetical protein